MLSRLQNVRRKVYLYLTTSERDVRNRRDYIMPQRNAHRCERDRVQRTNDVFHKAGHRGELTSVEAVTLQFRDMAWSFLLVPSLFVAGIVLLIFFSDRQQRTAVLLESQKMYTQRLVDAGAKREALVAELSAARVALREEQLRHSKEDESLDSEIARLTSLLEEMDSIKR